jgi:hypothetical protein
MEFEFIADSLKEVMDRQSAATSSRKPSPMVSDIVSGGKRMLFMPYGAIEV